MTDQPEFEALAGAACPVCMGPMQRIPVAPCHSCGHNPDEIGECERGEHEYHSFTLFGHPVVLCDFCDADFGSYYPSYLGLPGEVPGDYPLGYPLELVQKVEPACRGEDWYCESCRYRGDFLAFLSAVRNSQRFSVVTAQHVEDKLRSWEAGALTASALHDWAGSLYAVEHCDAESDAVNEVLAQLDMMDMNLVTVDDVPVLVEALRSSDFVQHLQRHFQAVNIESRKQALASDPMYAPFCKSRTSSE